MPDEGFGTGYRPSATADRRPLHQADKTSVAQYLLNNACHLQLRTYGNPIVHAPGGLGKVDNDGFEAFIPLIDSGISLYVWSKKGFFATVLFMGKHFDVERARDYTRRFWRERYRLSRLLRRK